MLAGEAAMPGENMDWHIKRSFVTGIDDAIIQPKLLQLFRESDNTMAKLMDEAARIEQDYAAQHNVYEHLRTFTNKQTHTVNAVLPGVDLPTIQEVEEISMSVKEGPPTEEGQQYGEGIIEVIEEAPEVETIMGEEGHRVVERHKRMKQVTIEEEEEDLEVEGMVREASYSAKNWEK